MSGVSDTGRHDSAVPGDAHPLTDYASTDWFDPPPVEAAPDQDSHAARVAAERAAIAAYAQTSPPQIPLQGGGVSETSPDLVPWLARPDEPRRRTRDRHATRHPALGIAAAIVLTLISAFFGWVSAQPFWLSAGLGTSGTATVTSCERGVDARCIGTFSSPAFTSQTIRVSGVPEEQRRRGATLPARMLDAESGWAYVGATGLQWRAGLLAAVLCCALVPLATGVRRLRTAGRGAQLTIWAVGFCGPFLLTLGVMVATLL